jgi:hypothetical protein
VLHKLGRRVLDLVIGLFALLGFFFVPLGRHTGFEHLKAIAASGPATEAYRGLLQAGEKVQKRLFDRGSAGRSGEGARKATPPEVTGDQATSSAKPDGGTSDPGLLGVAPNDSGVDPIPDGD